MSHYDTLGVPRGATEEEIRHAYLAKVDRLRPEHYRDASPSVRDALGRAGGVVDEAWSVLGDPTAREEYDRQLDRSPDDEGASQLSRAEHIWVMERELGWSPSHAFGYEPPGSKGEDSARPATPSPGATRPEGLVREPSYPSRDGRLSPIMSGLEAIAEWLGPHPRTDRTVSVPDLRGMKASEAFYAVAVADLQIRFVRLTENPLGGDGTVVDQDPAPEQSVLRRSTLTVQVVYPTGVGRPSFA